MTNNMVKLVGAGSALALSLAFAVPAHAGGSVNDWQVNPQSYAADDLSDYNDTVLGVEIAAVVFPTKAAAQVAAPVTVSAGIWDWQSNPSGYGPDNLSDYDSHSDRTIVAAVSATIRIDVSNAESTQATLGEWAWVSNPGVFQPDDLSDYSGESAQDVASLGRVDKRKSASLEIQDYNG